jgi:hypothetical protein
VSVSGFLDISLTVSDMGNHEKMLLITCSKALNSVHTFFLQFDIDELISFQFFTFCVQQLHCWWAFQVKTRIPLGKVYFRLSYRVGSFAMQFTAL